MASNLSRVVNLGAFGVVVHPALQNEPPYENDPNTLITKVFYHKKDYDALRKKRKRLAKILGKNEEGYQFQTYEREWHGRNLPPKVSRLLSNELSLNEHGNGPHNYSNTQFYPIRMSHLGISVSSIKGTELGTCDVHYVVAAMKKIYQTLAALAKHHTLHGDIHGGNILVYLSPPFCDMSLIDYDRFESYEEMKTAYHDGRDYMYGPPESYMLIQPHLRPNVSRVEEKEENKERENPIIHAYASRFYHNEYVQTRYPTIQAMEHHIIQAIQKHGDAPVPFHHIDSFLLSPVFLRLLYRTYPFLKGGYSNVRPEEEDAIRKTVAILEQGFSFSSGQRLGPEEIVQRLQRILCRLKGIPSPSAPAPAPAPASASAPVSNKAKKKNNGCVLSGGTRKKGKQNKTKRLRKRR